MKRLRPDGVYHNIGAEMRSLYRLSYFTLASALVLGFTLTGTTEAKAQTVATPYLSLGNGFGIVDGPGVIISQMPNSGDVPLMGGTAGCCPEGGYAFDFRLGVKFLNSFAIEGGVLGQGWDIGSDSRGGTGFGGGGVRLYILGTMEEFMGDFNLPIELSIGSLFGYTILGKDFAYTGSFAGFDGTLEWFATDFFALAFRINLFTPYYDNFIFTDFDGERGRCLDGAGVNSAAQVIHPRGSMSCDGSSPSASFISPQLVLSFYLDVF